LLDASDEAASSSWSSTRCSRSAVGALTQLDGDGRGAVGEHCIA
jgi:hypothetical protein